MDANWQNTNDAATPTGPLAALREAGWSVAEQVHFPVIGPVDAAISHPEALGERVILLDIVDGPEHVLSASEKRADISRAQGLVFLIGSFETEGEPEWVLMDRGRSQPVRASVSGLCGALMSLLAPRERPRVWICQYVPGDRVSAWTRDARAGSTLRWKTGRDKLPSGMQRGDPVVYWRAISPADSDDRGGVVGTGMVLDTELTPDAQGLKRFPTRVVEFFGDAPLVRDEVIRFAGIGRKNWQGAVLDLPAREAEKLDVLLRGHGHRPLFPDEPATELGRDLVRVRRDDAEVGRDSLGRAPLAVSLAWTLHEVWCRAQGLKPFAGQPSCDGGAGFVAHIDAPWGGGKTTFANLVARTLHPGLDGEPPEFLKSRYVDRTDWSAMFIPAAHELGALKDGHGDYAWETKARRPWIIVPFNAWQHHHVEPPWWCFYQTILRVCLKTIRREGLPTVEQDAEGRYATTKSSWWQRHSLWARLLGREFCWPLLNGQVLFQMAVAVASLLVCWFLVTNGVITEVEGKPALNAAKGLGAALAFLTGAGAFIVTAVNVVGDAFVPGRAGLSERLRLGGNDPLARFRRHFSTMMRKIERPVLVIIDDLDRCQPSFIVELTRGLQTILTSPNMVALILGDRNWIEQAFEVQHKDMSKVPVGPEHTFGGRFVEKAIQLSFVLPAISDHQGAYVEDVLSNSAGHTNVREGVREDVREKLKAGNAEQIGSEIEAGERGAEVLSSGAERGIRQAVREEMILSRAARKAEVEKAIRHRLQPIARHLPGNPRHIKRIINAISLYQDSILLTERSLDDAAPGKRRWRELVIGVILMMGYPKSWALLAAQPELADQLGDLDRDSNDDGLKALRANRAVVDLLRHTKLFDDPQQNPVETIVTADTVRWLNRIIPSGKT